MECKNLTGAEIVVKALTELNIEVVFGYSGSYAMPMIEALHKSGIRFIQPTSECSAAHAADGYYRASGKIAGVMTTSGPGATNLITGIATAYMDSVPMLALTANVPTYKLGKDSFQEVDITGIATPITKYAHIIKSAEELEGELKKAYALSLSGRTSPVLIDVPYDVLKETGEYKNLPIPAYRGAKGAESRIRKLAEKAGMPIFTSLRGISDGYGERLVGAIGSSAPYSHNRAFKACDVILALGTRFSDRMYSKPTKKKYIQVDSDAAEIEKVVTTELGINAGCSEFLDALTPLVEAVDRPITECKLPKKQPPIKRLAATVLSAGDGSTVFATDVGSHQIAFLHSIKEIDKNALITSLGLGTMGFGLPALIGALVATGKRGILITGDGSFNMNFNELATAKSLNLDLTVVVANNCALGMILDLERLDGQANAVSDAIVTPPVNYALLARSFGAYGKRVSLKNLHAELLNRKPGLNVFDVRIKG